MESIFWEIGGHCLSSGYQTETNGQAKRSIQELGRLLQAYCSSRQHKWALYLIWAEYAKNSIRWVTTGLTPFECVLEHQPPLCLSLLHKKTGIVETHLHTK